MTIYGHHLDGHVLIEVSDGPSPVHGRRGVAITVCTAKGDIASIVLDGNHAEALETAIRAARLELEARAVSL